jgi:glycosyltransferase involved in cell wall biosynthesis
MKMKVLHIITTIERGGAEKQLLTLVRAQVASGMEVHVAALKGKPELEQSFVDAGVTLYIDLLNKNSLHIIFRLNRFLKVDSNTIVHAHLPKSEFLARIALIRLKNVFVVSRHNAEPFAKVFGKWLSRIVARRANLVIAISDFVRNFLIESQEVSNADKIVTVHYSYDPELSIIKNYRIKSHSTSKLKLITIGRLVPQKNYPFLLRTLALAAKNGIDFRLIVLGSGELEMELKELAVRLQLSDKIDWLGKRSDVQKLMQASDALLMASKYEGFGLVLLEAMQIALPVIAPNISTFPEVLGSDYSGLFDSSSIEAMEQAIAKLYNARFYGQLSRRNLERLDKFKPEKMVNEVIKCYERARLIKLR